MQGYEPQYSAFSIQHSGKNKKLATDKKGFTLTEILLVAVILAIVGLSVYGAFNNGIKVWDKMVNNILQEDINIFFEKIAHDLGNSFQFTGINFEGTEEEITFPTLVASQEQGGSEDGIGCVTYYWDGLANSINREQSSYSQLYQKITPPTRKLVKGIETLSFQYYCYDPETERYYWRTTWEEEEESPLAVKVKVEFYEDGKESSLVRTISIPHAQVLVNAEEE